MTRLIWNQSDRETRGTEGAEPTRILLVEDNLGDAMLLRRHLKRCPNESFEVHHIESLAAMQSYQPSQIDVVLLDLHLPDAFGVSTVEKARALLPNTPIVVLTGLDDDRVGLEAVSRGAQDYLNKDNIDGQGLARTLRYAKERARHEELKQHLAHSDRLVAVGQLAAGVAHEINNPASFIMGNCSILQEYLAQMAEFFESLQRYLADEPDVERRRRLATMLHSSEIDFLLADTEKIVEANLTGVERIAAIVQSLKVFGRAGVCSVEAVKLNDVVEEACMMVRQQIVHRAQLITDLGPVPTIAGDRVQISQIVVNLLLNATQALDEDQAERNIIKITTRYLGNRIVLSVEDTGCGIEEDVQARIFDPFFTTKPIGEGTGLGLALCAEIIRQHHGEIHVESTPGQGTRFDVILPEGLGADVAPAVSRTATIPSERRKIRILVVDDETEVLESFGRMLREIGDVEFACSGSEAIERLDGRTCFDVVVCDLMMPQVNGAEIYDFLRQRDPSLAERLVFCTGGAVTARAQDFLDNISNPILQKPVTMESLRSTIARIGADFEEHTATLC